MVAQGYSNWIHGGNEDQPVELRAINPPKESTPATQSPLTPFPSLTGLRDSVGTGGRTVVTYTSSLSLSKLQDAADRYHASPTALLQVAWAKILEIYTGTKNDDTTFSCILPSYHDNEPSRPSPLIFCSYNAEEQGQAPVDCVVRLFHARSPNHDVQDEPVPDQDEDQHDQQKNGSLLDLEGFAFRTPDHRETAKGHHYHSRDTAAVLITVSPSTTGLLSLKASALINLLDDDAAQLMLAQYDRAIESVTTNSHCSMNEICTHFPSQFLSVSNPEPTVSTSFASLQSQFEFFAGREPERIALEFKTPTQMESLQSQTVWTYAELNHRAETLAVYLQDRFGSLTDEIVAICMDRCPEIYIAVLGILKAGAAWCPIDPSFPPRRRHDLIARAGAKALVVNVQSPHEGIPENVVAVDMAHLDWSALKQSKGVSTRPDSLAYLIWTSGTTGLPKGVPISHHAAVTSMRSLQARIPTDVGGGKVRCLQFSQFTFDVFVQDLFYTWGVGGTLLSADRITVLGSFSKLTTQLRATHAHLTPAFAASVPRKSCPTLQVVTMIGEKLTQNVADDWSEDCRLYNTYGPAETTVVSTLRLVPYKDRVISANVGSPLPSVSAFVIQNGEVVMRNGLGELGLGGPQLSKGYWKDLAKTRERFVWNDRLKTLLYMTGDIVRQLYDGSFEFIGRTDDLIKVQGIRVELSEIAFALSCSHSEVQHVEVLFLERADRPSKLIVAFLAAPALSAPGCSVIQDERAVEVARKALDQARSQLPAYMIPKVFLVVSAIPRTPSAKVDRAAMKQLYACVDLGLWEGKLGLTGSDDNAAFNLHPNEFMIIESIAELTGTSKSAMSRQSTLPSIGVDSITATRLVPRLRAQDIAVTVTDILGCSKLEDLFRCSREGHTEPTRDAFDLRTFHDDYRGSLDPGLASHVELVMPVLPLQESLLSESFQNPSSYWSNTLFALDHTLDIGRLEYAWEHVAQYTDALRIAFCPIANISKKTAVDITFLQIIYKKPRIDWTVYSCSANCFETQARTRAQEVAEKRQENHFMDPLWAVSIFRLESRTTMMISMHHAIRDELSLGLILEDLKSAYFNDSVSSINQGRQLRDAVSLLYTANTSRIRQDEQFWTACLSPFNDEEGSKSWPELRLSEQKRSGGTTTYSWHAEQRYSDLRARAASIGAVSLAAVLRVIWGSILLEYLETHEIVFGETWSARGEASSLSEVVGPLVTVIPVPFRAQSTFREMLRCLADFQTRSKAHRGVHPRQIRKILGKFQTGALYPAIFNFVPDAAEQRQEGDSPLWQRIGDIVELNVEHAIALNIFVSRNSTLQFELTAARQWNDQEHLRILARQIDAFLNGVLDNPDVHADQLSSRMPRDLLSLTPVGGDTDANRAWAQPLTHWVDCNASVHPDWLAAEVVSTLEQGKMTSEKWSYEQLQRSYRKVAAMISGRKYTKRMIAVCLDRRLDVYAVILAIMSTGNTYLPIADDLPEERKLFLLRDSDAAMLFTTSLLASTFSSTCPTVLVEEIDYSTTTGEANSISPLPTDGAYLLYTSGSTGTPKGVVVSRGNLMSFIEAISHFVCSHVDMFSLRGKGKWLGMASYAFDVHLLEMFFAWRHGMATATAPRAMLLDNLELALQKLGVTHASFVPSLVDNAGLCPSNLPDLRYMSLGGEKISKKAIDTWSRSHVVLANAYGPTEVTIGCCFSKVAPTTNVRNIGFPLAYTVAHVLRPDTIQYVMRGTSGELCLTGDLVAIGYHKRPDAKGFIEDFHGQKLYRTGDRVRLMADGSLEFLGRDDDQTKIRGQRIELGEVSEAVRSAVAKILEVDSVETSSLVVQHRALARPQLVAFIAAPGSARNGSIDNPSITGFARSEAIEAIRAYCRSFLPSFMVPEHFIRLTSLPLVSTSRKVNTKQLRALFNEMTLHDLMSSNKPSSSDTGAMTDSEKAVRGVAAEILLVDQAKINADSSLFQFGLDSLNVISLALKLKKIGFCSSVSEILKEPTVKEIACQPRQNVETGFTRRSPSQFADLEQRFKAESTSSLVHSNSVAIRPCLPLQETLVASSLDGKGEALYVNHVILQLSPEVDHERLIQAWITTAKNNDILRTCFPKFGNQFVQLVLRDSPLPYDYIEPNIADDDFSSLRQRESEIGFEMIANIESKPPIRLTLAATQAKNSMLLVSLHHALYDADSFAMILDEVYASYQTETSSKVRTPITALIDYIDSQNRAIAKAFWTRYLRNYNSTFFTLPAADDQTRSTNKELITQLADIEHIAASLNGTAASVMQALFGIVLAETHGTDDIVFGAILSGRTVPVDNAHSIISPCITTIPQRVRVDQSSSLQDIIRCAQKGFVESIEYQHTSLRAIHRWVDAENPLFDSLFTYTRKRGQYQWSHLWCEIDSSMPSGFPLAVEMIADQTTNRVIARCDFTPAFGSEEKVDSMLERLETLSQSLVHGGKITLKKPSGKKSNVHLPRGIDGNHWAKEETILKDILTNMVAIGSDRLTRDTTFFSLGVDSITAIQFAKQVRQHGFQCSSADVMRFPSIGKLAQHIVSIRTSSATGDGSTESLHAPAVSREDLENDVLRTYPCTPLQSSMLTQTLGSDENVYVHHHAIRLLVEDDALKTKSVWNDLVKRTEILRTSFHFSGRTSTWWAAVHRRPSVTWNKFQPSIDIEQAMLEIRERFLFRQESHFAKPPWAATLLGDVFILSLHHSLYDGESIPMLFNDFWDLLRGSRLPPRLPFSRAAEQIRKSNDEAENYWMHSLRDFPGEHKPFPCGEFHEAKATLEVNLDTVLEGCRSLGVTLQSLALLAFGKTLAWLSKRHDVVFGHVVRGRNLSGLEADNVVGPLFNTVPMRVSLGEAATTNKDVAQSVQRLTGESQVYQHASLNKVQQAWRQTIGEPNAELFHTLFVFQKRIVAERDRRWTPLGVDANSAPTEYSTNVECEQGDTDIKLSMSSRSIEDLRTFLQVFEYLLCDTFQCPSNPSTAALNRLPSLGSNLQDHTNTRRSPGRSGPDIEHGTLETVRRLLAEASGISSESIAEDASIFSLGLDSISAIHLAAAARKETLKLSVADVLQGRTVRGICQRLDQKQNVTELNDEHAHALPPSRISRGTQSSAIALAGLRDHDVEVVSACLPGQHYHLLTWLKSDRTLAEGTWAFTAQYSLDVGRLRAAWRRLRERHPLLRTLFVSTAQTEIVQVVLKPAAIRSDAFQLLDLTSTTHAGVGRAIKHEACRRFDLFVPPTDLLLIRDQKKHHIILRLHHALYDAWTIPRFIQDLNRLYEGVSLPAVRSSYSLIQTILYSASARSSQDYWQKSLSGCQETILHSGHEAPPTVNREYFFKRTTVQDLHNLESRCQQSDTSLSTVILVAFARMLAKSTGVGSPVFGLYQTGRSCNIDGWDETYLPYLNVTPLTVRGVSTRNDETIIEDLQSDLTARVPFEQSSLRDVLEWIGCGQKPLFNTFINILWGTEAGVGSTGSHDLLVPWTGGNSDDFVPEYRMPGRTAVEELNTSLLADGNLFLDVQRCPSEDNLRLVIRCDYRVLSEEQADAFVRRVGKDIEQCTRTLESIEE
ncbi:MAG: hypothetical protein LQ343_000852 [Gyalolechia ehrenbergii]|nr:MAG: hypothetical protein LQ343_000852 [Gyalolechia ehrenbergii]